MKGNFESWVTLVLNDRMGWEALVLVKSLKRTLSSRPFSVFICEDHVSKEMRCLLLEEFHMVDSIIQKDTCVDSEHKECSIFSCSISLPRHCVFLDCHSLVLELADDLFQEFSAPTNPRTNIIKTRTTISRSIRTFNDLNDDENRVSRQTVKNLMNSGIRIIDSWISLDSDEALLHSPRPKVICLRKEPWILKNYKPFESRYYDAWIDIFNRDLFPRLLRTKKSKEFLFNSAEKLGIPLPSPIPQALTSSQIDYDNYEDCIAIVGMSCRFPGSNSVNEFWDLLKDGRYVVRKFPHGRRTFDIPGVEDFVAGFLSCPIDEFDAKFFEISPREAQMVDPQQRLLLEVIWESLEDAGINAADIRDSATGVFIGILEQNYAHFLMQEGESGNEFHHRFLGNALSATAGRISHFMGFNGPNVALESGCSSSLAALHLGCESLRRGESNLVISGGVNICLIPRDYNGAVLAEDFKCKVFDETADGFVSAEGVATLVLKRFRDAVNDGDNIRAIIRGSALGNDGASISFGTPNAKAQARVCKEAMQNSGVEPGDVGYIEAHGTGTTVGDVTELTALVEAYTAKRTAPLWIGSVKTNIGHGESAAGIASVFKMALSLQNKAIPKNLFFERANPRVPLDRIPAKIPVEFTPWTGDRRCGGVSSFSMTGTLVHFILESTPQLPNRIESKNIEEPQVVLVSAKTSEALEMQKKNYLKFFKNNLDLPLVDVAYATNVCRTHFHHRIAVVATDMQDLMDRLAGGEFEIGKAPTSKSRQVGFLFTGQATQYFGMGKQLYEKFAPFRNTVNYCDEIYKDLMGESLKTVLWEKEDLLQQNQYAQPAIFCLQVGLVELWAHFGMKPSIVLGHSVGEFAAAVCAGVISIKDGLKLIAERGRLMCKVKPGRMTAIQASISKVEELMGAVGTLDVAAVNSSDQVVVAGSEENIEAFEKVCSSKGIKATRLGANHAFHSRDVEEVLDDFGSFAEKIKYNPPQCTYISSTLGRKMEQEDFTAEYWQCHMRETVRFAAALTVFTSITQTMVEIGPQPVLLRFAMESLKDDATALFCPSIRKTEENWRTFYTSLCKLHINGVRLDWSLWFGQRNKTVSLPKYAFQRQKFWFELPEGSQRKEIKKSIEKQADSTFTSTGSTPAQNATPNENGHAPLTTNGTNTHVASGTTNGTNGHLGTEDLMIHLLPKLETVIKTMLHLPLNEPLDEDQTLTEFGIDSLMGIELSRKIQTLVPDVKISTHLIQDYPTMKGIITHIASLRK